MWRAGLGAGAAMEEEQEGWRLHRAEVQEWRSQGELSPEGSPLLPGTFQTARAAHFHSPSSRSCSFYAEINMENDFPSLENAFL